MDHHQSHFHQLNLSLRVRALFHALVRGAVRVLACIFVCAGAATARAETIELNTASPVHAADAATTAVREDALTQEAKSPLVREQSEAPNAAPQELNTVLDRPARERALQVSLEFPHLLQIGVAKTLSEHTTLSTQLGGVYLPLPRSRSVLLMSAQVAVRYHFLSAAESGAFAGVGLGYQRIHISLPLPIPKAEGETQTPSGTLKLGTVFITPHLGWQANLSTRLAFAVDLGWQIAVITHAGLTPSDLGSDATSIESAKSLAESASRPMRHLAALPLPSLTLARLIYRL